MSRRVTWPAVLAFLLVFAGVATPLRASLGHRASPGGCMAMAVHQTPASPGDLGGHGRACGVDCPMHCAAVCPVPDMPAMPLVARPAFPPGTPASAAGWPPHAVHGPPRPLA